MIKHSEQNLQIFEETLDHLPVAVAVYDNHRIYYLNHKALETLKINVSKKKSQKLSLFNYVHKSKHKEIKRYNQLVLSGRKLQPVEIEVINGKKEITTVEVVCNTIIFDGKKRIQAVFNKLSKTKIRKTESEKARLLLQKISAGSLDVIFHLDFKPRTKLKFISDSSENVLGFSPPEIYSNPGMINQRVFAEDRKKLSFSKKDYNSKSAAARKLKSVVRYKHKNGSIKHLEVTINPVHGPKREVIGLIGDLRDVTEREETQALLVETKERFDIITNNGNDIIAFYTFKPKEKYLYISPNAEKIIGFSSEEILSEPKFFETRLLEGEKEFYNADKELRRNQKKNIENFLTYSFKIRKKNGDGIWLENNLIPISNKQGKTVFYINILHDITLGKTRELEIQQQYDNYRNLLDNSPVAYLIHDNGRIVYVNNALVAMVKAKNKNMLIGGNVTDRIPSKAKEKAYNRISKIQKGSPEEEKNVAIYMMRDFRGSTIEVEVKSVRIIFNNRECILSLINNLSELRIREQEKLKMIGVESANALLQKEISERQEAEKSLTEKTAHLSSIFESSTHLLWTVNRDFKVISYNKNFSDVLMELYDIKAEPGIRVHEHVPESKRQEYIGFWYSRYNSAFKGNKLEFEKMESGGKQMVCRKIFINPIYNDKKEIGGLSCIAHDITDSKIYEQKLLNQTAKLTAIFDSSHHYIWTIDRNEKLTSFNKNYYDLVTALYNTKPYVGLVLDRGVLANDKEYTMLLKYHYNRAFGGIATSFEIETRDQENKNVYLEIFLNPIYENNTVAEVSGIAHNITEKKHVQQKMEVSLKEKEILLREVHHRVKNNMQVISSILNLQSSYVSDEYALTLLKESQNRIKTMAYIHESLYQNKSFTSVNFSEYVNTLVNNIVQSYSYSSDKIKLEIDLEPITLSLDSSIPAGLIINELITNAIKHAFPGNRKGTITFNLRCQNNLVILELRDNGVGFTEGLDFENSHSLGLQLVNTLTEQIDGKINFKSELNIGTEVTVIFNK